MYRVVLDANQIVSAFIKSVGNPARILDLFREGAFEIVISQEILKEIENVLIYPRLQKYHGRTKQEIKKFLSLFADLCISIDLKRQKDKAPIIKDDPSDDKYLFCALEGKADFIIYGDKHLLNLFSYKNIRILTAVEFLKII